MIQRQMSQRAALVGVLIAFAVGIVGSLAVRPPGAVAQPTQSSDGAVAKRISWRLPVAFATNLPVLGENAIYVTDMIRDISGG